MLKNKKSHEERYAEILKCAIKLAEKKGFYALTRDAVAAKAKMCGSNIFTYFKNMESLRNAVMHEAIISKNQVIIAQGVAARHPYALNAVSKVRREAILGWNEWAD